MSTGHHLVPVEGGNKEHLSRLQDTVLHPGLAEEGELLQVRTVQVHLGTSIGLQGSTLLAGGEEIIAGRAMVDQTRYWLAAQLSVQ